MKTLKIVILLASMIVTFKSQALIQCKTSSEVLIPIELKYECTKAIENQADSLEELDRQLQEIAKAELENQDPIIQSEFKEHYDLAWYRCGHVGKRVKYEVNPDLKFTVNTFSYYDEGLIFGMNISSDNKIISQKTQKKSFPTLKMKFKNIKNKWDYITCSKTK